MLRSLSSLLVILSMVLAGARSGQGLQAVLITEGEEKQKPAPEEEEEASGLRVKGISLNKDGERPRFHEPQVSSFARAASQRLTTLPPRPPSVPHSAAAVPRMQC